MLERLLLVVVAAVARPWHDPGAIGTPSARMSPFCAYAPRAAMGQPRRPDCCGAGIWPYSVSDDVGCTSALTLICGTWTDHVAMFRRLPGMRDMQCSRGAHAANDAAGTGVVALRCTSPRRYSWVEISPGGRDAYQSVRLGFHSPASSRDRLAYAALAFAALRTNGRRVCPCPDMVPRPWHPLTGRDDWLGSRQACSPS
jgi:hypothetical protein